MFARVFAGLKITKGGFRNMKKFINDVGLVEEQTVSYTHLDVYKRQGMMRSWQN